MARTYHPGYDASKYAIHYPAIRSVAIFEARQSNRVAVTAAYGTRCAATLEVEVLQLSYPASGAAERTCLGRILLTVVDARMGKALPRRPCRSRWNWNSFCPRHCAEASQDNTVLIHDAAARVEQAAV